MGLCLITKLDVSCNLVCACVLQSADKEAKVSELLHEVGQLKRKHAREVADLEDSHAQGLVEAQHEHEDEVGELVQKHAEEVRKTDSSVEKYRDAHDELQQKILEANSKGAKLAAQLAQLVTA